MKFRNLERKAFTLWMTVLSGAGKTTLANRTQELLVKRRRSVFILDGDLLRLGLCNLLGYSRVDRTEKVRCAAEVAKILKDAGVTVIASFISPMIADRSMALGLR